MKNKCLVIYASHSGNTEKVARRMRDTFVKHGWDCDIFKIEDSFDIINLPFDFDEYDFVCVGSWTYMALPTPQIVDLMRFNSREKTGKRKIEPGPKCAIAFATYGGAHLGPREAEANLKLLEIEVEHLGFKSIGTFSCPGKMMDYATPELYHGDIRDRPNQQDLQDAEEFIGQVLQSEAVRVLIETEGQTTTRRKP
jgi:hypothetical protein